MKKTGLSAFLVILVFAVMVSSCDEFFSSSFGNPRKYDESNIDVSAGNIDQWVDLVVGNPDLALPAAEAANNAMDKTAKNSGDRAKLLEGGIELALEASEVGPFILSNASDALGKIGDDPSDEELEEMATDIVGKIQGDFNAGNGPAAAELISEMVGKNISDDNIPVFDAAYAEAAKPADVAEAVMVLALGELHTQGKDVNDPNVDWGDIGNQELYPGLSINDADPDQPQVEIGAGASPTAVAMAAYLNLIVSDDKFGDNPLTDAIRKAFFEEN